VLGPSATARLPGRLSFRHPVGWKLSRYRLTSGFSTVLAYLSTARLHPPCVGTATSETCGLPLKTLPAGGVLILWSASGSLSPNAPPVPGPGTPTTVGGRAARVQVASPPRAPCGSLHADASIEVTIAGSHRQDWYEVDACIRSPHIRQSEAQVLGMLRTVTFAP